MTEKLTDLWSSIRRMIIVFDYKSDSFYTKFKRELDQTLNQSNVDKLDIIVVLPQEMKKDSLQVHRLIHYISPKDFTIFGKLKGDLLSSVTSKEYDAILYFEDDNKKLAKILNSVKIKHRIGVNSPLEIFDIDLKRKEGNTEDLLSFVKNTLIKISVNE